MHLSFGCSSGLNILSPENCGGALLLTISLIRSQPVCGSPACHSRWCVSRTLGIRHITHTLSGHCAAFQHVPAHPPFHDRQTAAAAAAAARLNCQPEF
jgi:hypothetical protein